MQNPLPPRLRIAIVVASLRILGGQAVQAQRLIDRWEGDPSVDAWIVPIDPIPPAPFDRLLRIKYVRTLVTQVFYWPLLFRELRKADVVHAFSASYTSFLLAPLPAVRLSPRRAPAPPFHPVTSSATSARRSRVERHISRGRPTWSRSGWPTTARTIRMRTACQWA
jgi:hypothetical protein